MAVLWAAASGIKFAVSIGWDNHERCPLHDTLSTTDTDKELAMKMNDVKHFPQLRGQVVEKDIFRFDFILREGKRGYHHLFDNYEALIQTAMELDDGLSESEQFRYDVFISKLVILPTLTDKRAFLDNLSMTDRARLFQIYLQMVDQYEENFIDIN